MERIIPDTPHAPPRRGEKLTAKKPKMKRPTGRPRVLESPEQALERGEAYFAACDEAGEPYLITGLALGLGLVCRQQLDEYQARDGFTDVIKRLRGIVEAGYERRANESYPAGAIFVLKNMKWTDRQDLAVSTPDGAIQIDPGRDRISDEQLAGLITLLQTQKSEQPE